MFGDQVLIANNSGKQWGGIYVLHSIVSFQGNHTVIANNSGEQGGGVYAINSFITFNGCTIFRYNKALLGGGIISLYSGIVLHGFMQFTHNTARSDGGAIHASGGNVTIAGTVIFSYNSAKKGGAKFYDISATLNLLTNVSFSALTYNIYSTEDREEVTLYTEGPCTTGVARAIINVTLSPCPDGFMKHNEFCVCEERLQEYNANCTIDEDVSIVRNAGSKYWVSGLYVNQTYQGLICVLRITAPKKRFMFFWKIQTPSVI